MAAMSQVAGGPVGGAGGMMMMKSNGSPAQMPNMGSAEATNIQFNTHIYEYFLKIGHYDVARMLAKDDKFEIRTESKQSSSQRRGAEVNGDTGDGVDMDMRDDIPDDLPRPAGMDNSPGNGFLYEWYTIFSDLFSAHRTPKGINGQVTPAQQYLLQHQQMQRFRENQQNQNLNMNRPGMVNPQMMRNVRPGGMVNGDMARNIPNNLTPQQIQQLQNQKKQMVMQQQMQRAEQQEGEMNGRPGTPADGDNGGSPSKRPRLDGQQQFANGMMPNGRPGVPGVGPQGMMIQSGFQPNMNQAQFRQNGAMPPKAMQAGMGNGMMNMGGAGSPMMQNMNQFPDNMQMEMYQQGRMPNQAMQGAPGAQSGNHALQDYQMQLMLLEQQNKKRLMMARQEQHENNPRDGSQMQGVGMQPTGMSPSGSRSGTSPNPTDQMKRTPQLGGLPGSPSAAEAMQGRSPAAMGFMNGMQPQDFNGAMFMKNDQPMMGQGVPPGIRPPTSAADMNVMARQQQQQQGRMNNQFQGGQPMAQQASQGGQQPLGTPGPRNEMPPPQAPAGGNSAQRGNQPASPANSNAPATPSLGNKANPKNKKAKDEPNKKRPTKKNSTANAPASDDNPAATPTPSTPINSSGERNFNASAGKGQAAGMQQPNQQGPQNPALHNNPQQMGQQDMGPASFDYAAPDTGFNLDFSTLENTDVLENFDFDSFLNTSADDAFNFDGSMGVDASLTFDNHE